MNKTITQIINDIKKVYGKDVNYKRLFDIYNHYTFDRDKFVILDRSVAYVHQRTFMTKHGELHYFWLCNDIYPAKIYVVTDYMYVIRGYYINFKV